MLSWEKTVTETPNVFVDNLGILQMPHEGGGAASFTSSAMNPKSGLQNLGRLLLSGSHGLAYWFAHAVALTELLGWGQGPLTY